MIRIILAIISLALILFAISIVYSFVLPSIEITSQAIVVTDWDDFKVGVFCSSIILAMGIGCICEIRKYCGLLTYKEYVKKYPNLCDKEGVRCFACNSLKKNPYPVGKAYRITACECGEQLYRVKF